MEVLQINYNKFEKEHWSAQEKANVKLIISFVQHLMNDHNFTYVKEHFSNNLYRQHNRSILDGMDALIDYVKDFVKRYPEYTYDVKHIHADGDIVSFHSHATIKAADRGNDRKGLNIMDTWRIDNGQIVEHWDALQPLDGFMRLFNLLAGGKVVNENGVF